jgi:hypothetical protein
MRNRGEIPALTESVANERVVLERIIEIIGAVPVRHDDAKSGRHIPSRPGTVTEIAQMIEKAAH